MRARFLLQVFSLAVIVLAGAVWLKSRATAVELQTRLATLTTERAATQQLLRERDALRTKLKDARPVQPATVAVAAPMPARIAPRGPMALGEWRTSLEWRNEGQSTAREAIGTLLWAASGGDITTMTSLLAFDDAARKKARELFDGLPPAARLGFATPQAFVASLMTASIPNQAAQLSWYRQRDDSHATVGLLLRGPNPMSAAPASAGRGNNEAPQLGAEFRRGKFTSLLLERSPSGWQIVMPAVAIERLARTAGTARPAGNSR